MATKGYVKSVSSVIWQQLLNHIIQRVTKTKKNHSSSTLSPYLHLFKNLLSITSDNNTFWITIFQGVMLKNLVQLSLPLSNPHSTHNSPWAPRTLTIAFFNKYPLNSNCITCDMATIVKSDNSCGDVDKPNSPPFIFQYPHFTSSHSKKNLQPLLSSSSQSIH